MSKPTKITITDLNENILFEFQKHEYPESIPLNWKVKINPIEYPDDHYTNQIIGMKPDDTKLEGVFHGTYMIGGEVKTAWDRSEQLRETLKKVVRVVFAVGGSVKPAYKNTYVVEALNRDLINLFEVKYELVLKPHQPQPRVVPGVVSLAFISSDGGANPLALLGNVQNMAKTVQAKVDAAVKPALNAAAKVPKAVVKAVITTGPAKATSHAINSSTTLVQFGIKALIGDTQPGKKQ